MGLINIDARVKVRVGTETDWLVDDPIILNGEEILVKIGVLFRKKVGDGFKKFSELDYNIYEEAGQDKGLAQSSTNPGTPTQVVNYDAIPGVTYTHFLNSGSAAIVVPTSSGGNSVYAAKLIYNLSGGYWELNYSTVATIGYTTTTATGNQLFDKTVYNNNEQIITSNGNIGSNAGFRTAVIILDNTKTALYIAGLLNTSGKAWRFEAAGGGILGGSNVKGTNWDTFTSVNQTIPIPIGAYQFRFSFKRDTDATTAGDTVMLNYGTSALPYESYFAEVVAYKIDNKFISAKYLEKGAKMGGMVVATENQLPVQVNQVLPSRNLANAATTIPGYMDIDGSFHASGTYSLTAEIPVTPGLPYTGWDGIKAMRKITFFNSSHTVIAGGYDVSTGIKTFVPPAGVAGVRISFWTTGLASFQFEQNSISTAYVPYGSTVYLQSLNGAVLPNTGTSVQSAFEVKTIGIADVERITIFGDSYNAGSYNLKGKNIGANLSRLTDWNIENYSKSGDDLTNIHARILANTKTYHPQIGIKEIRGGGYGVIISYRNDETYMNSTISTGAYLANLKQVADDIKAMGYKPIIATEHLNNSAFSALFISELSQFCNERGYIFIDILTYSLNFEGTRFPGYYFGTHPNVRAILLFWWVMLRDCIRSLPRAKTGIKIFKPISTVVISNTNQFLTKGFYEKCKILKEIFVTQFALGPTSERYYDDMTALSAAGTITSQAVYDYLNLINGDPVSFTDYAVVDCIVNSNAGNVNYFGLFISDTTVSVSVRDWSSNAWVALAGIVNSAGETIFDITDYKKQINYDKIEFLLYKPGGFSLTNINYRIACKEGKDYWQREPIQRIRTAELLANTKVDVLTSWTVVGLVTPFVPSDSNMPAGVTKVVILTTANYLRQSVTFAADTTRTRRVQVIAVARVNPTPPYSSSNTYPTGAAITSESVDIDELNLTVKSTTNFFTAKEIIGLHWTEVIFEFMLPSNVTVCSFEFKPTSNDIEFCMASIKIEA